MTKVNNIAITYDAAGNPTKWYDIESLTWTGTQLTTMVFGVGPVASYAYNDNGQRTKRSVGFRSTLTNYEYHYDANGRLVYETIKTAEGRNDKITYIYDASGGLAGLAYKDTPGAVYTYFYERNGQGEIIGLRPGETVTLLRVSPMRRTFLLQTEESVFALGREAAECVIAEV